MATTYLTLNDTESTLNTKCDIFFKLDELCTCWSYTAKYKNSSRFYRVNGPGEYPKSLRVPDNVDVSTGRMIDEGELIQDNDYNIL